MKADGRPLGENGLHFVSNAEGCSGAVNFTFEDGRVETIGAMLDPKAGQPMEFAWSPNHGGAPANPCSDLPGSRYARCNK
jgi:hypothetical protein